MANKLVIYDLANVENLKEYKFQSNSVVIVTKKKTGEYKTAVNFGNVKNTKTVTLYMEILKAMLVEDEISNKIHEGMDKYDFLTIVNGDVRTIKGAKRTRNEIASRMNTNVVYRTNSEGVIVGSIVSKDFKLKDTYLHIKNCKGLVYRYAQFCAGYIDNKTFTNDLYFFAKKAEEQMNYFTNVNEKLDALSSLLEIETEKKAEKKAEKKIA